MYHLSERLCDPSSYVRQSVRETVSVRGRNRRTDPRTHSHTQTDRHMHEERKKEAHMLQESKRGASLLPKLSLSTQNSCLTNPLLFPCLALSLSLHSKWYE